MCQRLECRRYKEVYAEQQGYKDGNSGNVPFRFILFSNCVLHQRNQVFEYGHQGVGNHTHADALRNRIGEEHYNDGQKCRRCIDGVARFQCLYVAFQHQYAYVNQCRCCCRARDRREQGQHEHGKEEEDGR